MTAGLAGCGEVEIVRLDEALPEDLRFPIGIVQVEAGGDGRVYLFEDPTELERFELFVPNDGRVFLVDPIAIEASLSCTNPSLDYLCAIDCGTRDVVASSLTYELSARTFESTTGQTLQDTLRCRENESSDCNFCS